jgi:hypothetical protein
MRNAKSRIGVSEDRRFCALWRGRIYFCLTLVLVLGLCLTVYASKPTTVEVLYMNHGPLKETINKMKSLFTQYGAKVNVSWYDFDSPEGEKFMAKKGIKQHVPLIVWIDGTPDVSAGARKVQLAGFPSGSGPASFQGKWTMDDLKAALDQATAKQ